MTCRLHTGDAIEVLSTLEAGTVQTIVTSPPYYGLRDYGVAGQLGQEDTPRQYLDALVRVFREARRVLKDDGTVFLNLGDSYMASGPRQTGRNDTDRETPGGRGGSFRGGSRTAVRAGDAPAYGTSGTAESGCPDRDSSSQNPDGARTGARSSRTTDSGFHPALGQVLEQSVRIRECMEALLDRLPSEGSQGQRPTEQSLAATRDIVRTATRDAGLALASLESMPTESYLQHPEGSRLWDSLSAYQSALRSFAACAQAFARTSDDVSETPHCTEDNASLVGALEHHIRCIVSCCSIVASWLNPPKVQPQRTTILKPKNLIGIPWRVAFALQDDGWILRQDIIWHKPNPMPESVRDRCTRAHEYVFLLTKSERYYYDHDAIKEQPRPDPRGAGLHNGYAPAGQAPHRGGLNSGVKHRTTDKQRGHGRRHAGFNDRWDDLTKAEQAALGRNKRSVWTVATRPYPEAHFATYPPQLIEPCILAGSRPGDTVLDPFNGSGTTGEVALRLDRCYVGIEINPEYVTLTQRRLAPVLAQPRLLGAAQ